MSTNSRLSKPHNTDILSVDTELLYKYDQQGPRYTSYPTALQLSDISHEFEKQVAQFSIEGDRNLSLYIHIPFCRHLCYYCACNKVVTKRREKAAPYLEALKREIRTKSALFEGKNRTVEQLHLGGGTPTFISAEELDDLLKFLTDHFKLVTDGSQDYSIEIDPREFDAEKLTILHKHGFNRASIGVQDFNEDVQIAVHRLQSIEMVTEVYQQLRDHGFSSINFDLIYGLPKQSVSTFKRTLEQTIELGPDRLSIFNYAHMPHRFAAQNRILASDLPPATDKISLLQLANKMLIDAGYVYIGMDHFTKPDDILAKANKNGTLHRNFQGYSTHSECDLIALGASAISQIGPFCYQNHHDVIEYTTNITSHQTAAFKGYKASAEDMLRREVIMSLICTYALDINKIESQFNLKFNEHFKAELSQLVSFVDDGLLEVSGNAIQIAPKGRLFLRNICMVFDTYLPAMQNKAFSKVI